ncbi:MAG: DEAD/DEAH box helicase [Myxococcales bacterium]|jgi:non-specific serine/threonine protein kinase|nr:DEAD/DEAH box helicase [Myxococcales bacterium]
MPLFKPPIDHAPGARALRPVITPHGHLRIEEADDGLALAPELATRLTQAFARGSGHGLLQLGAGEVGTALPPELSFFRELASRYVAQLCALAETGTTLSPAPPIDLEILAEAVPPMTGAEYVTPEVLALLWRRLDGAFLEEHAESALSLQEFLKARNPAWNLVGRLYFNLAENRRDDDAPFAFLATYTTRLSSSAKAQHVPLGRALQEYAGAANKERLLSLLLPVQRAAQNCPWLKAMVDSGEIFHPLRWTPHEALQLLRDVPALQSAGVVMRLPATWSNGRPPRPRAKVTVGANHPSVLAAHAMLDFSLDVTLDGETLTNAELRALLAQTEGMALVRGRWVEVDRDRLQATLDRLDAIQSASRAEGLSFAEASRLLSGVALDEDDRASLDPEWSQITAGPWLAQTLRSLRSPEGLAKVELGDADNPLKATLRPYQTAGVQWLHLLAKLGLGACLADDMGLGKTIQVLSLLLAFRTTREARQPSLLVAPASLLSNWASEAARFTPSLDLLIAHPSAMSADELKNVDAERLSNVDLVVTSYGSLLRVPWLAKTKWRLVALDEAQAIKNPDAKQTRAAKALDARARIALTGTPVENRLMDLWSIFDFINPGLLGGQKQFAAFAKGLATRPNNPYGPLRDLVRPYILRRLKTDKSVAPDLPAKTELKAFCSLSKRQAALYQQAVTELAEKLESADGIQRRGAVLAALMRFKQICNHPSQWLGDGGWSEADSGKLARLRELAEVMAERQEKLLVFTQFKEMTRPLSDFLGGIFGKAGLVLHGETAVARRKELVRRFQEDESVPFFVLSLKAGGAGLNLTAASHVVHFDRWWNPAVEDQATDRAFRIGQTRNVLVHKFICRGTIEEKIDQLIESKKTLTRDLLQGGAELNLTELQDDELLKLVALDLRAATEGS